MTVEQQSGRVSLARLTWIVVRDVHRTLGGGLAAMELLRRTFVANRSIDDSDNAGLVAVSRLTPGTNVLAYCVGLGWSLQRWSGALAALVAASLPGALLVCVLTVALVRIEDYPAVRMLFAVGVLAATVLVFSNAVSLLRPYVKPGVAMRALVIAAVTLALIVADVTPVRILLLSAAIGAALGVTALPVNSR